MFKHYGTMESGKYNEKEIKDIVGIANEISKLEFQKTVV